MGSFESPKPLITGLAHINILVPAETLPLARAFYGETLGLTPRDVPSHRKHDLAWFDIGTSGQQVHVALGPAKEALSSRHPCFKLGGPEELLELRRRVWEHFERKVEGGPMEADRPGAESSGQYLPMHLIRRAHADTRLRRQGRRIPATILCARLRRQQTRVQPLKYDSHYALSTTTLTVRSKLSCHARPRVNTVRRHQLLP